MLLNQAMCKPSLVSAWCNLYRWCSALDGVLDDEGQANTGQPILFLKISYDLCKREDLTPGHF
jgi:hypothetical protein